MASGVVCLGCSQPHCNFSIVNTAFQSMYSSLEQSGLGDFHHKMSSIKHGAKTAAEAVSKFLREWSVHRLSRLLFNCLVFINPKLSSSQQSHLMVVTSRTIDHFLLRGYLDEQLIKSMITLAAPDHGTSLLLNYLVEIIAGLMPSSNDAQDYEQGAGDYEDMETAHLLIKHHGIDKAFIAAMSPCVRKAVLRSLRGGGVGDSEASSPICCITLEPLLWPDCSVTMDVVAVIQRNPIFGKEHAFLYRGDALLDWLGRSQVPISPETRSIVKPGDLYRLS